MTLFGKILIGLILALSLVFASLSAAVYSAQTNYRDKADGLAEQLAQARQQATDREAQLQTEIGDLQTLAAQLKDERDLNAGKLADKVEELRLEEDKNAVTNTGLVVQTALTGLTNVEADARRQEAFAQRDRNAALSEKYTNSQAKIAELTDELFGLEVAVEQMNEKQNDLLDQVASYRAYLRGRGLPAEPPNVAADQPAPKVEGKIVDVQDSARGNQTFVEITLGSDDGLRRGDKLYVYNRAAGGKYLGEIQLRSVDADAAVGQIVSRASTGSIQKGDDVSTRL